jgi:predicted phosphodiesterase
MAETFYPQYDELYVVSDLHMGGRPGFQILWESKRLAEFVRLVGGQNPEGGVGLVLNGDVIDSLAEDISGYIAGESPVEMITRIIDDPAFVPVWSALADFVGKPGRSLIIVIGNHDLELALPAVQRTVEKRLADDSAEARGRIYFSTSGAGFTCQVGASRIFCIHGNEEDSWNLVYYEPLLRLARDSNAGLAFDPVKWEPNAGTKLVKDIMNTIKPRFAWIDLLKPETKAAVGVLAVLDPEQVSKISRGIPILWEKVKGTLKLEGLLSADETAVTNPAGAQDIVLDHLLGPQLLNGVKAARPGLTASADEMLLEAELSLDRPERYAAGSNETLGLGQLIWDRLTGVDKPEALRRALLDWLRGDKTFDLSDRDETFTGVTAKVGAGVDFIITGHTHLERAIEMDSRRCYFNCGTWIRLLKFSEEMLASAGAFKKIYEVLVNGSMEAIDQAEAAPGEPFVLNQTSAVRIRTDAGSVVGELLHIEGVYPITCKIVKQFRR